MSAPDTSFFRFATWSMLPTLWHRWRYPAIHRGEASQEQRVERWTGRYPLRIGLAVVGIALLGLLAVTLLSDRFRVHDEAAKSIHNVSLAAREHLSHVFAESERLVFSAQGAARRVLVDPAANQNSGHDPLALVDFFKTVQLPPYLFSLAVSRADGTVIQALGPLGQGGADLLRSHLSDKHPISDAMILSPLLQFPIEQSFEPPSGERQSSVIFSSRPLFAQNGELIGWITTAIKPEFFGSFFRAMELGVGGLVQVVRRDGSILIRTPYHAGSRPQGQLAPADMVQLFNQSERGQFDGIDPVDGVDRLYAYESLGEIPLAVIVGMAKQDVYGDWARRAMLLGLFGVLAMGVIALLARQLGLYLDAVQASRLRYRNAEEHLSQAQALAHLGSWQWVLPSNRMWWSAEMKRLCGLSIHDPSRQPSYDLFLALVHPADRARLAITIGQALEDGQSFELDHRLLLADGTVRHVHQEGQCVLGENGEVDRLDCVLQDVSQAAELQAQLADAAKLSTLGEMASGMAHELSQPLNIIHMTAEGALIDLESVTESSTASLDERVGASFSTLRDAVMRIAGQAERMGQVLDHIRIFSRRDSGPAEIFDAAQVVRRTLDSLGGSFDQSEIALHSALTPDLRAPVMGHAVQLEQVLMNLLINGKEAALAAASEIRHPAPGVGKGWINLSAQRVGSDLQVLIHDSGRGIADNQIDRLFEPFFTTKEAGAGPGLGLSVAYGIISAMGGKLTAQNSPQGGAVFELRLPIQLRALAPTPKDAGSPQLETVCTPSPQAAAKSADVWPLGPHLAKLKADKGQGRGVHNPDCHHLLFIERVPGALMAMRMHLARKGFLTSTAETIGDAEAMVRSHALSLVITDHLTSPDLDRFGPQSMICASLKNTVHAIDPQLPILGLAPHHPGSVSVGRPVGDACNIERGERGTYIIHQAVGMGDLCDAIHAIQRNTAS